jgi:hypothetical protein
VEDGDDEERGEQKRQRETARLPPNEPSPS